MTCHLSVDAGSGLVHTMLGTSANINDVTHAHALVHGEEADVFTNADDQGVEKPNGAQNVHTRWHSVLRLGLRRPLDTSDPTNAIADQMEHVKARIRAQAKHPLRVIKRRFGHVYARYVWLAQNSAQLHALFALSYL